MNKTTQYHTVRIDCMIQYFGISAMLLKRQKGEVVKLFVVIKASSLIFIPFVVEKSLSTVQDVIGRVIKTFNRVLTVGKIPGKQLPEISVRDG